MPTPQVTVERAVLDMMLADQRFLAAFAVLRQAKRTSAPVTKGCGCGRKQRPNVLDYEALKRALVGMSVQDKARLKQLLNTNEVRIKYRKPGSNAEVIQKF